MRNTLLVSVSAIALIAGAGIAGAQEKSMGGGAQAPSAAPSGQMSPQAGESKGGAEIKGGAEKGTTGQAAPAESKGDRAPARAQEQKAPSSAEPKASSQPQQRSGDTKSDTKSGAASDTKSGVTTGQGAGGAASGSLTTEQRTRISTTIRSANVQPVTNVNFKINVGTVVPRTVVLHALPPTVIEVYPAWRPYRFILVGNDILVIDPDTYRIVAVLPA